MPDLKSRLLKNNQSFIIILQTKQSARNAILLTLVLVCLFVLQEYLLFQKWTTASNVSGEEAAERGAWCFLLISKSYLATFRWWESIMLYKVKYSVKHLNYYLQIVEKRRRDRINSSLSELRRLVPSALEKQVRGEPRVPCQMSLSVTVLLLQLDVV